MRRSILLALLLLLAGCQRDTEGPEPMELRQYAVPPAKTQAIANALTMVMSGDAHRSSLGQASAEIPGQVVVLATARMHASIKQTIETLAGADGEAAPSSSVRVDYWLVDAIPGAGSDDPKLGDVRQSIDALRPSLGESHFVLVEKLSLLSDNRGSNSVVQPSEGLRVTQRLEPVPGGVHARLGLTRHERSSDGKRSSPTSLSVNAVLTFGQTLLLAQQSPAAAPETQRLVLVRAQPAGAP